MNHLVLFLPAMDPGVDSEGNLVFEGMFLALILINVWMNLPIDIFSSWARYKLARRREISCPWLAWIPFVNLWVLGSLSDQYKLEKKDRRGWNRYVMLLHLLLLAVAEWASKGNSQLAVSLWNWMHANEFAVIPLYVVGIAAIYRSLHQVFHSCKSDISEAFLLISLLVPFATPILLLITCRWENE